MTWVAAELASADEVVAIARRAIEQIDLYFEQDDDFLASERRDANVAFDRAVWALRFCAVELGARRDPLLLPIVCEIAEVSGRVHQDYLNGFAPIASGLALALAGATDPAAAEYLVDHRAPSVRAALASGLRTESRAGRAMLDRLVDDPVASVREAARTSLEKVGGVAWWRGIFQADPTEGMTRDEAEALKPTFEAIVKIMRVPDYDFASHAASLRKHLARLPDRPARDVGEILFRGNVSVREEVATILRDLLARPGGPEYATRLVRAIAGLPFASLYANRLAKVVAALPTAKRQAVCDRLVTLVFDATRDTWEESDEAPSLAADVIRGGWSARGDLGALLDRLLGETTADDDGGGFVFGPLSQVLGSFGHKAPGVLPRIVAAMEAGLPGAWSRLRYVCLEAANKAPRTVRRKLAVRLLDVGNDRLKAWAIARLLGDLHAPSRDAPRGELAASLARDPRTRGVMLGDADLCAYALPVFREALRAGALPMMGAANVLRAIAKIYDGFSPIDQLAFLFKARGHTDTVGRRQRRVEAWQKERRVELADFLGPPEGHVAITDEEWAQWRRIRANGLARDPAPRDLDDLFEVLPAGPIQPEDRAFVEHGVGVWRETRDEGLAQGILARLTQHADPWLLPMLDEFARYPMEDRLHRMARSARRDVRAQLGMDPSAAESDAAGAADDSPDASDDQDWMDQDD